MQTIWILNGPNLNLLGEREPEIYGHETLADLEAKCAAHASSIDIAVDCRQSNHEGELVDWIQDARNHASGLILNAAAFTHTSVAIHDALKMLSIPIIEVHLSDPATRESFRHHSYVTPCANAVIAGQGTQGYIDALNTIKPLL